MVYNDLCPTIIDPNSPIKSYVVRYTNGMKKTVDAHNLDEAWNKAYEEPYEVLDVILKRGGLKK